jgi:hypothetical protein
MTEGLLSQIDVQSVQERALQEESADGLMPALAPPALAEVHLDGIFLCWLSHDN